MTPPASTIPELFAAAVAARGSRPALGAVRQGTLAWHSWDELAQWVAAWQATLAALGVVPGDRVAQVGANCLEWVAADLAIQGVGAVHVPLHASLAPAQVAGFLAHAGARLALVHDEAMAQDLRLRSPGVRVVLPEQLCAEPSASPPLRGETDAAAAVRRATVPRQADDLATILYTSGTTGSPLGVMLTHRNLIANAAAITRAAGTTGDETRLGILPLSHIYARTCDLYSWMIHGARLALAESRETIFRDLALVARTAINAVPYFYQKVVDRLRQAGGPQDEGALRTALGGSVRRCYCGGAALPAEVDRYFAERGLPILCGYGLTEASPVISATKPGDYRSGTVGPPLDEVEVRLSDEGEIAVRGPNVMAGYWQDQAATDRVLRDGWLSTGDLGAWDDAGHLRIVGRIKEMIVLATGKKVFPTQVEQLLLGSPWIEQACVVGDGRKCLAALIVPNRDMLRAEIRRRRLWVWSRRRATTHPQVVAIYRAEIDRCLASLGQHEQIAGFNLLTRQFSAELGEVTPKLSLCRGVIAGTLSRQIERAYRGIGSRPLRG
ncbi:MAG TPA: AMP-dependent synthetase/ligase [Lacipirellulaceae bacterium]|nr:AMP-dependent synthetase/ligase [Lacipirellulaceae bacterium]